jgi:hypothetical protein
VAAGYWLIGIGYLIMCCDILILREDAMKLTAGKQVKAYWTGILFPGMMVRIDKIESTVLTISSAYCPASADELTKYIPCLVDIYVCSSASLLELIYGWEGEEHRTYP